MNSSSRSSENEMAAIEEKLPLKITLIEPQKKNPDRFSLFHEGRFLVGVSGQTLIDYSIQKGVEMTPSLFRELSKSEKYQKVKDACYRYLSRRDHSGFELKRKVSKKGYSQDLIEQVVDEFSRKGLLDDENFANKFASDKAKLKQWGPKKIKHALYKKGIDRKIAEKVVQNTVNSLEQHQICVDLIVKRKNHFLREDDFYKRKQKIYRYLAGKGYSGSVIKKAMPQITVQLDA